MKDKACASPLLGSKHMKLSAAEPNSILQVRNKCAFSIFETRRNFSYQYVVIFEIRKA